MLFTSVANITDRDGAVTIVENAKEVLSDVKNTLADRGHSGDKFAAKINEIIGATVEVVKRNELHKFVVLSKRWVVERSFAWLEKYRRLWKNCERKINTILQMVVMAFIRLMLKRF
jgi:transposase